MTVKYIKSLCSLGALLSVLLLPACSKWTEVESKQIDHVGGQNVGDEAKTSKYYEDLRAWKATAANYARPVSFGWFSNWNPNGVVRKGYLSSLPDSIDMISMWSGPFNISEEKKRDKAYVQQVKGTKIFVCYLLYNIGDGITPASVSEQVLKDNPNLSDAEKKVAIRKAVESYWGFTSGKAGSDDHIAAIKRYAQVLCDSIVKYDYDGFDIDWEPHGGGFGTGNLMGDGGRYLLEFIKELGKYLGPKATVDTGKRRYLLIDGELSQVPGAAAEYMDYIISQAYGSAYLQGRIFSAKRQFGDWYDVRKHIFTENFESYSIHGGQLLRQAAFVSEDGPIGGIGAFRLDNDYDNQPDYKWMRQAIQLIQKTHADYKANKDKDKN